jgi:hypothetical protein
MPQTGLIGGDFVIQTGSVQTLGKIAILSNDRVGRTGRATEDQGLQAMRDGRVRDEKPNVRQKYLSPDEARRAIEAAGASARSRQITLDDNVSPWASTVRSDRSADFDFESRHRTLFVRRRKGSNDAARSLGQGAIVVASNARYLQAERKSWAW